ncbi:MAG: DEAD/DEAH box helicase [Gemmatimonadetes bacterium]|nr:DEAD/DEAH box helicase [Gemmatimonadota bacterium]
MRRELTAHRERQGGGRAPTLVDDRSSPDFRAVFGELAARSRAIEVAIRRIRLSAVELRPGEMAGVRALRLLVGPLDTESLGAEARAVAADARKRANLLLILEMLDAEILDVRASALLSWAPDFSVFHGTRGARHLLVGPHLFQRPAEPGSLALASLHGADAARRAAARFAELWADGRDVRPVALEILERAAGRPPLFVRETTIRPYGTPVPPAEAAAAALGRAFGWPAVEPPTPAAGDGAVAPQDRRPGGPDLTAYQRDAAERAARILDRRRGVLVCDSVGLGKTFIALRLIEDVLRGGGPVAVVSPAALRPQWTRPLLAVAERYQVRHSIGLGSKHGKNGEEQPAQQWRTGGLELGEAHRAYGPLIAWLSQARLSRGGHGLERLPRLELLVVDEAHNFRNPRTRRYAALARIAAGARVALLTATPVNNSAWDLYSLIRIFAGDGDFTDLGVPSLREAVDSAHRSATSLRSVVAAISVRRTREFIRDHYAGGPHGDGSALRFPTRAAPVPIRYSLEEARPGWYAEALSALEALEFAALATVTWAAHDPSTAGRRSRGTRKYHVRLGRPRTPAEVQSPVELVRLALLKRLESSLFAFGRSIRRLERMTETVRAAVQNGRMPGARELRGLVAGEEAGQLLLAPVIGAPLPRAVEPEAVLPALHADLERLKRLAGLAQVIGVADDPKLSRLVELLARDARGDKVVVFTEFRDTAHYLHRALYGRVRAALVDGEGARIGSTPAARRDVILRFAPRANGARATRAAERIDVLVTTDVLAEGLNLQDAARVVSYDLPWNPVRLIQRIGRIDRLGSPHELVHLYHFVPDLGLEGLLRLFARIQAKLATIGETVGVDGSVLGGEAPLPLDTMLDALARADADCLDRIERSEAAPFEIEERIRLRWRAHAQTLGGRVPEREDEPAMAAAVDADFAGTTVLCFSARTGPDRAGERWIVVDAGGARIDRIAAIEAFTRALEALPAQPDRHALDEALAAGEALLARVDTPPPPDAHAPESRALRALDRTLTAMRGEPDAELCRRVDRVATALARPLPAGLRQRVSAALDAATDPSQPANLLAALEELLEDRIHSGGTQPEQASWRLVAAVQFQVTANPDAANPENRESRHPHMTA